MYDIEKMLLAAGRIAAKAKRAGQSMNYFERLLLLEVRAKALRANYTRAEIEALIEEGKRSVEES